MNINSSEAIVLRHLNYGESDRIVTFFTSEQGMFKGFARGARKSRKRFGAAFEPFASIRLFWSPSRSGDLVSLKEAELLDLRAGLRQNLAALAVAGYGCELVEELAGEGQGHSEAFRLLKAFLDYLAQNGMVREARLLFELRLLFLAGYAPHLLHCSECGEYLRAEEVFFDAARGGSICGFCSRAGAGLPVSLLTLGSLARSLKSPMTLFEGFRFSPCTLSEGKAVLSNALNLHLQRPLKTLSFLESMLTDQPESRDV